MVTMVCRVAFILMALVLTSEVFANEVIIKSDIGPYEVEEMAELIPYPANKKVHRHIHSLIANAFKNEVFGGHLMEESNGLIETKFKTWKRNADLINSLLALPTDMNDAGRK